MAEFWLKMAEFWLKKADFWLKMDEFAEFQPFSAKFSHFQPNSAIPNQTQQFSAVSAKMHKSGLPGFLAESGQLWLSLKFWVNSQDQPKFWHVAPLPVAGNGWEIRSKICRIIHNHQGVFLEHFLQKQKTETHKFSSLIAMRPKNPH